MAEEVKAKSTSAKAKVAEKAEEVAPAPVAEAPVEVKEVAAEPVVKPIVEEVKAEVAEEATPAEEAVEVMSKRGRKSKAEKIADLDHELGVKINNEPHLEDLYRAEFAEKVAKLK